MLTGDPAHQALVRRGFALEYTTLGWNVAGIIVLAIAAIAARSVALAGFGLDSQYSRSASVKQRSRKPSPCRSSARRTRSISIRSMCSGRLMKTRREA